MAVTETTTESWGSRLGKSVKGVIVGLGLFVLAFPFLFWNEGNAVKTRKALEEGEGACISLESPATVDASYDGKLVHLTGKADTQDVLTDDQFGVSARAIKLARQVEMYQWEENAKTTTKKNVGGSETKTTTYTYRMVWSTKAIDSSTFKEAGHENPGALEFESMKMVAANVTFGAFRLSENQIDSIGGDQAYVFPTNYVCPLARVKVVGTTIYVPESKTRLNALNTRDPQAQPRIGDMRVTYTQILPHTISLVAKQQGDTFGAYIAKNGKKVQLLRDGEISAQEMFADAQSANTMMCWVFRLAGFLLMFFGLSMVLKPLSVLADVLPILGDIVGLGTGLVAGVVSLVCSLVTIAIAWLFYRPVLAVLLLAAAGALICWIVKKRKTKKAIAVVD